MLQLLRKTVCGGLSMLPSIVVGLTAAVVSVACSSSSLSSGGDVERVAVGRLDRAMRCSESVERLDSALLTPARSLFAVSGYGELTDSSLAVYRENPSIVFHEGAVDSVWQSLDDLELTMGRIKANFLRLFPDRSFPQVYAIVSPFNQSVITVDSMLFVGLNHYLGRDYPAYAYFPDYIRCRKTPERIGADVAEALVRRNFPYAPTTDYPTTVSRLLYEGAVVEAVMQLTGLGEREVLGYDAVQMKWLADNERAVWETIVGREWLFSSDSQIVASLVAVAPFTSVIGQEVPGGVGRFVGHRIVASFVENNDEFTVGMLLSQAFYDARDVLSRSGY